MASPALSAPRLPSRLSLLVLAGLLGLHLGACRSQETPEADDPVSSALREDAMARRSFAGLREVDSSSQDAGTSPVTGKPQRAEYRRIFAIDATVDAVGVLDQAAAMEGWQRASELRPSGFTALKTVHDLPATLTVALGPEPGQISLTLQAA